MGLRLLRPKLRLAGGSNVSVYIKEVRYQVLDLIADHLGCFGDFCLVSTGWKKNHTPPSIQEMRLLSRSAL